MNEKIRKLFSISEIDTEYFNDKVNKIELVNCKLVEKKCTEHIAVVNTRYREFERFHRDKDFQNSIEALKNAFDKTLTIKETSCIKCTELLRSTIIKSLENIHWELEKMSKGIFRATRYQSSYVKVEKVLRECKKIGQPIIRLQNKQDNYLFGKNRVVKVS